jgi:hypothetical protein
MINRSIRFPLEKNLDKLDSIIYEDNSLNSPQFFNVSRLNTIYSLGYSSFILRGSNNLKRASIVEYEMYDQYGTQIACRVKKNNSTIGASNVVVSFLIEPIHSNGQATLIIVGVSNDRKYTNSKPDIRWKINFTIDKYISNNNDLVFYSAPTASFSETPAGVINDIGQEVTIANVDLSSLNPFCGKLDEVSLYYRLSETSNDFSLATTYRLQPDETDSGSFYEPDGGSWVQYATESQITNEINDSSLSFSVPINIITKPTYYDIKLAFYDGKNEISRNDQGRPYHIIYKNIPFSGVDSLGQLKYDNVIGVPNVKWVNSPNENTEYGELLTNNNIVELTWADLTLMPSSDFPLYTTDIYGLNKSITYRTAQSIKKYAIWMFLTKEQNYAPEWQYPGKVILYNQNLFNQSLFNEKAFPSPDNKGYWYFRGFSSTNYASFDVPRGYTVSFWVGFVTNKTLIPTLEYLPTEILEFTRHVNYINVFYSYGDITWS